MPGKLCDPGALTCTIAGNASRYTVAVERSIPKPTKLIDDLRGSKLQTYLKSENGYVRIGGDLSEAGAKGAGSKLFKSQNLLESHYIDHGAQMQKALGKSSYSITNYLDDANYIIQNGTYVPELNGYVRFVAGQKYGFVGLDRATGDITTFHIKTVSELIKNAPSLGLGK